MTPKFAISKAFMTSKPKLYGQLL